MLAYDACATTGAVDGLIATCFLDPTRKAVRRALVRKPWMAGLIEPALNRLPRALNGAMIPMTQAGNMGAVSNDPALASAIIADRRAGGARMPLGFLRSWLESPPIAPPESFDTCPVLMVHPEADHWTDVAVSDGFFELLSVVKRRVILQGAGHFPVEHPGVEQMDLAIANFIAAIIETRPMPEPLI